MSIMKRILEHNVNNFLFSVTLCCDLYKSGSVTRWQLMMGLARSVRERMKAYHWSPSNF